MAENNTPYLIFFGASSTIEMTSEIVKIPFANLTARNHIFQFSTELIHKHNDIIPLVKSY